MSLVKASFSLNSTVRYFKNNSHLFLGLIISAIFFSLVGFGIFLQLKQEKGAKLPPVVSGTVAPSATLDPFPSPSPIASPTSVKTDSKILFGIGSQGGPAMNYRLTKEAPVHMLTSWYNGPSDLEWMRVQVNDAIRRIYKGKYVVHIVTWTDPKTAEIQTSHGPACGVAYPVSGEILNDMKQLAEIWRGNGQMYVTLFTEFQTYTCTNNTWNGNENYYNALKDNFRKIKDIFHTHAPGSKVAISWGGWQSRYDDPASKAGRSFFPYFDDVMRESDFTSFQAMESDTNINEITDMTSRFAKFGKPIMVSHYKPANHSQEVFKNDMNWLFTDETVKQLTSKGLFAFSFMDEDMINGSEESYQLVKAGVTKYGK